MPAVLALAAAAFLSTLVMRMTDPVVALMAHDFAVPASRLAQLATAYAIPYALFQLVFGPLGDRYGKTIVVRIAAFGLAASILATALAPSFETMMLARFVSGGFGGAIIPLGIATIGDRVGLEGRQEAISRFMLAVLAGQIAGAFLTGLLAELLPWRAVFVAYAAFGLGIGLLLTMVPRVGNPPGAAVTIGAIVRRFGGMFARRKAQVLLTVVCVEGALFFAFVTFTSPYLAEIRGLSSGAIGLVIASYGVGGILFSVAVRPILNLIGSYGMVAASGLLAAIAAITVLHAWPLPVYMALTASAGFAFMMAHSNLQTRATEIAPEARGSAVAIFGCFLFIGNGIGPFAAGRIVAFGGYGAAFTALSAGFVLFGALASLALWRLERFD